MKYKDIVVGGIYSNGKEGAEKSVRKIIGKDDFGDFRYEVIEGKGEGKKGSICRASMTIWMKVRLG